MSLDWEVLELSWSVDPIRAFRLQCMETERRTFSITSEERFAWKKVRRGISNVPLVRRIKQLKEWRFTLGEWPRTWPAASRSQRRRQSLKRSGHTWSANPAWQNYD
jgi:hypothetical protein